MTHSALVHWVSKQERGRASLPPTLRYVGIARFSEDGPSWPDGAWSVELLFKQPPPEQGGRDVSEADVRFLFDHAPQERLRPGSNFSVYEGPTRVAEVEVLN